MLGVDGEHSNNNREVIGEQSNRRSKSLQSSKLVLPAKEFNSILKLIFVAAEEKTAILFVRDLLIESPLHYFIVIVRL